MTKIQRVDPYLDFYAAQKQLDPATPIVLKQFYKGDVEAVDRIVELAHGNRDAITSSSDWLVMEELLKFFASRWPEEWNEFKSSIPDIRSSRREGGYSASKEIKYVMALPPRLEKLVKAIFPYQEWDKKFTYQFIKRFPLFKVG